jgi:GH15 family glucan-1,4-alpha-glucosidase
LPPDDTRVLATVAAIERALLKGKTVYRYSADQVHLPGRAIPTEGSFTMCGFWLVEVYALAGRIDDARGIFQRLLSMANDVGLFSEEFDVERGIAIGNLPQAFSHVGAINAACRLSQYGRTP